MYVNPKSNPYCNSNVDPKRTQSLIEEEKLVINDVHKEYPEMGHWNLALILSKTKGVHVSTMSILRTLYPEKYRNPNKNKGNDVNYYEKHRPYAMYHDNGGEYNNTAVRWLLKQFNITDVPTEVENPKSNGKKENAHSQDRKYFYEKHNFRTIE